MCILWGNNCSEYLVKLLRRQIRSSSGSAVCELSCSLTSPLVGTCGVCACCIRSRVVEFEFVSPIFRGSGEISCRVSRSGYLPLAGWGLLVLWQRAAAIPGTDSASLTARDPRKLEKENIISSFDSLWGAKLEFIFHLLRLLVSCQEQFLTWVPNQHCNGITHVSFNNLSGNNLLGGWLVQVEALVLHGLAF